MLFEPNLLELLPYLLQHYLEMIIYQSLLENYASEQAARMLAMKNATDNALEVIEELKLDYNKSRQEKITNEILDIGSAAFAYAD
jgi:F-type H+-transporting ATPase subunit gamma